MNPAFAKAIFKRKKTASTCKTSSARQQLSRYLEYTNEMKNLKNVFDLGCKNLMNFLSFLNKRLACFANLQLALELNVFLVKLD